MFYRIKVSSKTAASAVHAVTCPVVVNATARMGVHVVEAQSAVHAAANWDASNEFAARGLPLTRICDCAKVAK